MQEINLNNSIMPWLGKTAKMMYVFMGEKFRQHHFDITVEQMIILKVLHDQDGRPQQDMAMVTERHKASLTRLIDTMEKKNLVARIPDQEDKRINRIFLTTHGRKFFQSTLPIMREAMTELQRGLDKQEVEALIGILKKVQQNISDCI